MSSLTAQVKEIINKARMDFEAPYIKKLAELNARRKKAIMAARKIINEQDNATEK